MSLLTLGMLEYLQPFEKYGNLVIYSNREFNSESSKADINKQMRARFGFGECFGS